MSSSRNNWATGVTVALFALPILYVLSIGPVRYTLGAVGDRISPSLYSALYTFYEPLTLLYNHTPLKKPLGWYYELWEHEGSSASKAPIHTAP